MSTRDLTTKREPMTDKEAIAAVSAVSVDLPLEDWQKVILYGFLTGLTPICPGRARNGTSDGNARIFQALDRIEEARTHGLA